MSWAENAGSARSYALANRRIFVYCSCEALSSSIKGMFKLAYVVALPLTSQLNHSSWPLALPSVFGLGYRKRSALETSPNNYYAKPAS